jgi:hypothetical protein
MRLRTAAAIVLVVGISLPAAARTTAQDVILRERITIGGNAPYEETQYFSGSKCVRDDPQARTIVDLDAKTLMVLHKDSHTYGVTPLEDLRRQNERQKTQLAGLPAEARKSLGIDQPTTLKPTGKTQKIAGYQAREYTIEGGGMSGAVWVTDAMNLAPGAYAWENSAGLVGGPRGGPGGKLAEALAKLKGVPLRTSWAVGSGSGKITTAIEVLQVTEQPPPADIFAIPTHYRVAQVP